MAFPPRGAKILMIISPPPPPQFTVLSSWGDKYYVGLTGLQVLGPGGQPLSLTVDCLDAKPRDLNEIPGYSG